MFLLRHSLLVLLFFSSSVLVAAGLAYGFQEFFPYDAVRRTTPEEQFWVWEGLLWMSGLALILLGGAAAFGVLHLSNTQDTAREEVYFVSRRADGRGFGFSLLPWWMMSTGAVLLLLAVGVRARLPA